MGKMQRDKGARHERAVLARLKEIYPQAIRGNQKMGAFQPDVIIDDYWVECTHSKAPRVYGKIKQTNKDLNECDPEHRGKEPLIISRKDNGDDWATIKLDHFIYLLGQINKKES